MQRPIYVTDRLTVHRFYELEMISAETAPSLIDAHIASAVHAADVVPNLSAERFESALQRRDAVTVVNAT